MARIAIVFSGNVRCFLEKYKECWEHFFNNLSFQFDYDVFFHTFETNKKVIKEGIYEESFYKNFDKLIKKLNPKLYKIENDDLLLNIYENEFYNFPTFLLKEQASKKHILFQLYSIYQADLLRREYQKTNNFIYDAIVKFRFDLKIEHFEHRELKLFTENNLYKNMILTPNNKCHPHPGGSCCKICMDNNDIFVKSKYTTFYIHKEEHFADICDIFSIGSDTSMTQYSNAFINCKNIYSKLYPITKNNLKNNNTVVSEICSFCPNDIRLKIKRPRHEIENVYHMFYPEKIQRHNLKKFMILPSNNIIKVVRY
jgi:hypothetical protein